ncbi:uncharacterized protein ALTATR162_LOCUS12166 [Alternaria atra]|uniref:Uncharacterized protein n=1 Tax=Alternaria atra TaxID=119953 RepID=A0A8J2IIG7_9PLEO|nr:uncharacterized protein ALTATR162_LOCUS12166 [Alternaria atra]CAG5190257.1 unnamed protein product [Alternaria atra]
MFGHEPLANRLMKKEGLNDRPQPGVNEYTVVPDSEDEWDDDDAKIVDVKDQRFGPETITIHSSQNDHNSISFEHNQKRKRKPKDSELDSSRVDAITENDMRNVRKKRKALGLHRIQPTNKASHHPDRNDCILRREELNYIRTVIDVLKNRLPDYTEDRKHNAQKVLDLRKKNIETQERLIQVEEEKIQLRKANLELEKEKLKLEKKNLENEEILDDNESRQVMVLVRILERKLEDAGAQ